MFNFRNILLIVSIFCFFFTIGMMRSISDECYELNDYHWAPWDVGDCDACDDCLEFIDSDKCCDPGAEDGYDKCWYTWVNVTTHFLEENMCDNGCENVDDACLWGSNSRECDGGAATETYKAVGNLTGTSCSS